MQKKVLLPLMLLLGAGLSCDMNGTRPATTGSIGIVLLTPSGASFLANSRESDGTSDLKPIDAVASVALTSARLIVTGPTSKTVTSTTAGPNGFVLRADGLAPGTYAVTVEGLANGQVAHFGAAAGVVVTAGQETPANVTFPVFQPQIPDAAVEDTSDVLRYTVSWQAVQNATSYLVEWSTSPTMTSAQSQTVTGATTIEVTVPSEGKWYFTVKAVNAVVTGGGLASAVKPVFLFQGVATVAVTPATPSVVAGATQQMAAEGRDADNGVVANVTWFWASSNHTVATVTQAGLVTAIAPGSATITAVGKGMPGSTTLTVTPAPLPPATKLAFVSQPTTTIAGQTVSTVQVAVQTAGGQTVTTDDATQVVLSIGTNPGGSTLGGTLTTTVVDGVATFNDLTLNKSGTGYVLSAVAAGLTTGSSSAFNVTAGSADHLAFSIQPTDAVAGDPLSPAVQVEIRDINDNLVTSARDAITVGFASNPGTGTLTGTKVVNAINGIASFSGLWINKIGSGYTLLASATSLTSTTSSGFAISPAAPAKLAFSQQPTNVHAAVSVAPAVTVTIADQFDNPTTATSSVSLSFNTNPWQTPFSPGASLSGNASTPAIGGTATFGALQVSKPAPGYSLRATSGALTAAISNEFDVGLTVTQISAATIGSHTCAITTGGTFCFGYNGSGQLGVPSSSFQDSIAVRANTNQTFTLVTTGANFSCGLTAAGAAFCWGDNSQGQLGTGNTTPSDVPIAVTGGLTFAHIDAGWLHVCGVTTPSATAAIDRQVYCWGYNEQGQIGDGSVGAINNRSAPTRVATGAGLQAAEATQVALGQLFSCARAPNGNAYCWGDNNFGQLGDGTALPGSNQSGGTDQPTPVLVLGGISFQSITAGQTHACGISANPGNPASCWGRNFAGQLGNQSTTGSSTPVSVFGGFAWSVLSAGSAHTCGLLTTGKAYCWGNNGNGELGDDNSPTDASQPVEVSPTNLVFTGISGGANHTCGTTATAAYCWGYNGNGQLGSPGTGAIKRVATQIVQ